MNVFDIYFDVEYMFFVFCALEKKNKKRHSKVQSTIQSDDLIRYGDEKSKNEFIVISQESVLIPYFFKGPIKERFKRYIWSNLGSLL
jgi:hypothetical protein